jgi:PhnB protein
MNPPTWAQSQEKETLKMKMDTRTSTATGENEIRALLDDWTDAHRVKDADRITSHCAKDIVQFIMAPPLQYSGANAWDKKAWFSSFEGPIGYEVHDLNIATGDDTAFCHFLNRLSATSKAAGNFAMWNRVTLGLCKIDGKWLITHVHSSVPFYMDGSFKAAVDLKP